MSSVRTCDARGALGSTVVPSDFGTLQRGCEAFPFGRHWDNWDVTEPRTEPTELRERLAAVKIARSGLFRGKARVRCG